MREGIESMTIELSRDSFLAPYTTTLCMHMILVLKVKELRKSHKIYNQRVYLMNLDQHVIMKLLSKRDIRGSPMSLQYAF